jgi:BAR domain of APPL family
MQSSLKMMNAVNHSFFLEKMLSFAALSRAQRSLASSLMSFQFECIGSSQTDDEIVIAGSLKEFGRLINAIEDERDRMVNIFFPLLFRIILQFLKEQLFLVMWQIVRGLFETSFGLLD